MQQVTVTSLTVASNPSIDQLAGMAVLSLASPSSRRNYTREIRNYLASGQPLNREGIQSYIASLRTRNVGRSTINVSLAAIRLLAREAWARGILDDSTIASIEHVKGARASGEAVGQWISLTDVQVLLEAAGARANGIRDAAVLACMVGCGMRRAEVVGLRWDQWQQRDGRWCFIDIQGKGGRVRTIPAPEWVAEIVERWRQREN